MCGIAGELALGPNVRTSCRRARPMLDASLPRGPDGCGAWQDQHGRAALLHCRLAIVDIERGHQPMHDARNRAVITFNGEIYGFEELRRELQADGHKFLTNSDTEVLLALYLRNGPEFVNRLEGEFAFVIYDRERKQALLARDRFGVKPLVFAQRDGLLLFASEAKAILAHPHCERALNLEALHRRIHSVMLPDETVFKGIHAVAPGTAMLVDSDGGIAVMRHADLEPEAAGALHLDEDAAVAAFEEAFSAAVRERLQGDVPIGIFLSAGVDSNAVAAAMREVSDDAHKAFTIGFDTPGYGEADDAAAVAEQLGFDHHIERIGAGGLDSHFAKAVWQAETIVPNGQGIAKMQLSGNASRHVKVILAGEGADEIHGGYAYFRHAELLKSASDPGGWRAILRFLREHGFEDGVMARATPLRRNRLAGPNGSGVPYAAIRASLLQYLMGYVLRRDFQAAGQSDPAGQLLDWLDQRSPGARKLDDVTLSRFTSAVTDMPTHNFTYLGDRAEMANSIEGRLPFLDKRVVDLLWGLPYEFHLNATTNKTVIRGALSKRLPLAANRYKRMFTAPSSTSKAVLEGPIADRWLSREAIDSCGYYRPKVVRALRSVHRAVSPNSEVRHILEGFLMTAISAHMLDHLFCRDFSASLDRYAVAPTQDTIPGLRRAAAT